jgi:hypothetical protein
MILRTFFDISVIYCLIYRENHTTETDILCGQNGEFYYVQTDDIYCNLLALKG